MKLRSLIIIAMVIAGVVVPAKLAFDAINAQTANAQDKSEAASTPAESQDQSREFINNLAPNEFTPQNYIPPSYDPFNNLYRESEPYSEQYPTQIQPNTKPVASFMIESVSREGFLEKDSATVGTKFRFNAFQSDDEETDSSKLQVRWDYEGDGKPDTYFSTIKTANHIFNEPGIFYVTLEVLDKGGAISKAVKKVTIVENTPPIAYQIAKIKTGTPATIFEFDTSKSSDSQYMRQSLLYRFDWDNDGVWDTTYKVKTGWRHKFDKPGQYRVVMEVKDPEGLTDTWYQDIEVIPNTPPVAQFTVSRKNGSYTFDASASSDAESPKKLQYRWDFNYSGPNDIIFDTQFVAAPKHSGSYGVPGHKTVRLQVKDIDGAVSEAFATFEVQ
jgi:PKD repeat protein